MHNLCMIPFFCIFLVVLLWRNRNWANGDHRSHSLRDLSKLLGLMNILSIFIQNTFNLFLCFDYIICNLFPEHNCQKKFCSN